MTVRQFTAIFAARSEEAAQEAAMKRDAAKFLSQGGEDVITEILRRVKEAMAKSPSAEA